MRSRRLGLVTAPLLAGVERLWANKNLAINGQTINPAMWFDGSGLDSSAKTWTCRQTGTVLTLSGAGADPTFAEKAPHLTTCDGSHQAANAKLWVGPDNSFGNVGTDDVLLEYVTRYQTNSLVFGKLSGSDGIQVLYTASVWRHLFNDGSGAKQITVTPSAGLQIMHCWVNRDEASTNGSRAYANAVGGSGVDCSSISGSLDQAVKMAFGHNSDAEAGAYGNLALLHFAQWHAADLIAAGSDGKDEMDALVKQRASLYFGTTARHNHASLTPESF
jgi:hypothetical protein